MRKTLLLFVIVLLVASCDDKSKDTQMTNIDLKATSSDLVENVGANGLDRFYSCHFSIPEITSGVFNNGLVTAYIVLDNPTAQKALPFVYHFENTAGKILTQTIDFDYTVGGINVYVRNSDFAIDPSATMKFRVVIM